MKNPGFPEVSAALMKALEAAFPDRLPTSIGISEGEVGQLIGQQDVLRFLRKKFEDQNKTVLEGTA